MDYCNSEYCGDEPWPGGPVKDLPDIGIYGAPNAYFLFAIPGIIYYPDFMGDYPVVPTVGILKNFVLGCLCYEQQKGVVAYRAMSRDGMP
jgi:hypothetical protein